MISKELLSEVLPTLKIEGIEDGKTKQIDFRTFRYIYQGQNCHINIHELAHKCKEWAFKRGYTILSYPTKTLLICVETLDTKETCFNTNFENPLLYDPNMNFDVCQWILENKDK